MIQSFLYDTPLLPEKFKLSEEYVQLAKDKECINLEPWQLLFYNKPLAIMYYGAMLLRYTDKPLIPFAVANDQSGIYNEGYVVLACFDGDDESGNPKVYFHDYSLKAYPKWSERYFLKDFSAWFEMAVAESKAYRAEQGNQ